MKKLTSTLLSIVTLLLLASPLAFAQKAPVSITYNQSAELYVNNLQLSAATRVDQIVDLLGEPSSTQAFKSGEMGYRYEEAGIVFFTHEGQVKGLGVNFNWDGDAKYPEKSFTGELMLGEANIKKETKSETLEAVKSIEFVCPFPLMCASKDRTAKVNCTAGFKDGNLSQVVFLIR